MDYDKVFLSALIPKVGASLAFLNFSVGLGMDVEPVLVMFRFPESNDPLYVELLTDQEKDRHRAEKRVFESGGWNSWYATLDHIHENIVEPATPDGWTYKFAQYVTGLYLIPSNKTD